MSEHLSNEERIAQLESTVLELGKTMAQIGKGQLVHLAAECLAVRESLVDLKFSDPQAAEKLTAELGRIESQLDQSQAQIISVQAKLARVKLPGASPATETPPES